MQRVRYYVVAQRSLRAYIACYECNFNEVARWSARWTLCHSKGNVVELMARGGDSSWFINAVDAADYAERSASRTVKRILVDGGLLT
jgi:hypothetical protein